MGRSWVGGCTAIYQVFLVAWSGAAVGAQICESSTTTSMVGEAPVAFGQEAYFACADGEFLVAVDVSHVTSLGTVRWRCSDGEESTLFEPKGYLQNSTAVFDIAITEIEARSVAEYDTLTFLGDIYIRGYNESSPSSSSSAIFAEAGPFGTGNVYTEESTNSTCSNGSFATGVYFWYAEDPNFVFAIQLECAEATDACSPFFYTVSESAADDGGKGSSSSTSAAIIGGSVGGAVLILAIFVGVMLRLRRRHQPRKSPETYIPPAALVIQAPASRKAEGAVIASGGYQTSALAPPPPGYESPPPYSAVVEVSRGANEG